MNPPPTVSVKFVLLKAFKRVTVCVEDTVVLPPCSIQYYTIIYFCEQGGRLSGNSGTLTFLKKFSNTNYSWLCSIIASDNYTKSVNAYSFTTSGCTWRVVTDGGGLVSNGYSWEARGYI